MILNKVVKVDLNENVIWAKTWRRWNTFLSTRILYVRSFNNLATVCSGNKVIEVQGRYLFEQNLSLFNIISFFLTGNFFKFIFKKV